ncbi:carbohydrate-binding module family 1 protein [Sphaerobolus stellatus SS14]|uniref:Glucanase n=1 Tax=Sphaerobolus stellatus (strain SS14) TaxID=990650 RepID=A0A0C9U0B2_SPHS4|nr:carbohydrate-binding module family 1 protein [Sphaerobolus stellatus SS14]
MFQKATLLAFSLFGVVYSQQVGTLTTETHPPLTWQKCTTSGGCTTVSGSVVVDANWRWLHSTSGSTNCYTGNTWNTTLCPDGATCAANCALDGADYKGTYGVSTSGNALSLTFVTRASQTNVGSRLYLMADDSHYQLFTLLNKEFTFDVDVSNLPCGLNGALYFSEMDADGGLSKYPTNKAGAKYGTGYCDSQCPRDIKFINGVVCAFCISNLIFYANALFYRLTLMVGHPPNDVNAGTGKYGSCCNELDIWEANSVSAAYTPHPCTVNGQTRCTGEDCAINSRYDGLCDPDGCDFNSFRQGDKTFYGKGLTRQHHHRNLTEIRRLYVQNGVVIQNSKTNFPGIAAYDSITDQYCTDQKTLFGDTKSFQNNGGLKAMGGAMGRGMVLVMSVWDDHAVNMLWLDSTYPTTANASQPGIARGTCATTSGAPTDVENNAASSSVTYSNIRFGDIGSTFSGTTGSSSSSTTTTTTTSTITTSTPTTSTTTSAPGATQTKYGQCGGIGYTGPTACTSGSTCQAGNPYYSQCL